MATEPKPISQMLEATTIADADLIEVVVAAESNKSLKNQKVTGLTLKSYVGGSGHVIQDNGTPLTQQPNLNFVGATVTNDALNNATKVEIPLGQKETIFFSKSGSFLTNAILDKPGGFTVTGASDTILAPYDCVVNEIYVDFECTVFTTAGDLRARVTDSTVAAFRTIGVNATGFYRSTNIFTGTETQLTLTKGETFYVDVQFINGLAGTFQNILVGVILEAT